MSDYSEMKIEEIPCQVLQYAEERDKMTSAVGVNAIIRITKENAAQVRKSVRSKPYFDVELPDGFGTRVKMRFGKIIWQNEDPLHYLVRVALVEDLYDNTRQVSVFDILEPEQTNARLETVRTSAYILALEHLLVEKNILTPRDLEKLQITTQAIERIKYYELYKVDDVMKYWDYPIHPGK